MLGVMYATPLQSIVLTTLLAAPWQWVGRDVGARGEISIRLIRGSVRATATAERSIIIRAQRHARRANPDQVEMIVSNAPEHIELTTRYPARSSFTMTECLPPVDERGDFYRHDGKVDVDVDVPTGWSLHVEILECNSAMNFDLGELDGTATVNCDEKRASGRKE